ncbi:pentatricopeptide repeat-containing protein [Canna indica]|uniref:Pentatricopeptide repeat-containing protein n=1 Tax=Canna indica TaxID=4628 RepID=A0AAQ3KV37_9LILI|nr:pentatricopeptide repeat-containing protein [Canna indica]
MRSSLHLQTKWRSAAKTHASLVKSGEAIDICAWNKVLAAYSNCSGLLDACKLFDEIPQRDTASWNSLIAAHVSSRAHQQAWAVFKTMLSEGMSFDQYTFGSVLKSVACTAQTDLGRQLHSLIVKSNFDQNVFSGSALIDMYAKCGRIREAVMAFELMPERNAVSWNTVIAGYARVGDAKAAFQVSSRMEREGLMLEEATFASLLTLLDGIAHYGLMSQAHAKIIKYGRTADTIVYNAAITAYWQCGSLADSRKVFDKMDCRMKDLVTWNSMLAAYACHGCTENAIELFIRMQKLGIHHDMYTFTSVISACFEQGQHENGRALHGLVIGTGLDSAVSVSNALIAMYSRPGEDGAMEDAWKCFECIEFKDPVSWNSLLTALSQNGSSEEAVKLFAHMQSEHVKIDHYAFSATLRSCADLAVLQLGRQIHGLVLRLGFAGNDFVGSSLVYMYSKCGVLDDARQVFDETLKDSSVTWNSMVFGYAQHGQGQLALDLFSKMQESEVAPDHITFVGLITACSHIGLVEEGSKFLKLMQPTFGVPLRMEHYACGVDLFGRAGRLDEAMKLIESMPFEPDAMVWMTLLGACRTHGDMELASHVAERLLVLEPKHHSTYVLLSHMCSGFGMWDDKAMIQKTMRNRGLSKVPGWSWIEVMNEVHSFNAEDRSHPQAEEIYKMLELLVEPISSSDTEVLEFM